MSGLGPGIHRLSCDALCLMECRVKPGNGGKEKLVVGGEGGRQPPESAPRTQNPAGNGPTFGV